VTSGTRGAGVRGLGGSWRDTRLTVVRIDLHVHSTASDGTQTPAEVVRHAADLELDVIALTDHDSAAGWTEAALAARREGVTLIPGVEISTRFRGAGVHVLAYLPDLTYPALATELQLILDGRDGRLAAIIEQLRGAGVDISEEEVRTQAAPSPAIGRPHIADVLVAKGVVADRSDAFARWLAHGMPGYVVRYATPTATMIRLITESGGAAVIAHPWGRGSRRVLDRASFSELIEVGLVGLEVDHQDHRPADRLALDALASDLGLVSTGSSDFHGAGKIDHDLGCNVTDPGELDRLLDAAAANAEASGRPVPQLVRV
jgi:predicted metal-dependent phosphoesterase TrpH